MKVLELRSEINKSQEIRVEKKKGKTSLLELFSQSIERWNPPPCYIHDLRIPRANFFSFGGTLVFDKIAYNGLHDILERAGQVFPLEVDGAGQLFLLNVLENLDVLDQAETERVNIEKKTKPGYKILIFDSEQFNDSSVFKVASFPFSATYTYQGRMDSGSEFIGRYAELGLTGLKFQYVWSDEAGQ